MFSFPKRNSFSSNSKSRNGSSNDESSIPLIGTSLSDKINAPNFASDRSETIVFFNDKKSNNGRDSYCTEDEEEDEFIEVQMAPSHESKDSFAQIMRRDKSASEFHCLLSCMSTVDDLARARTIIVGGSLDDLSKRDYKGETPMHAFSNNKSIAMKFNPNAEFESQDYLQLYRQPTFDQDTAHKLHEMVEKFLLEDLLPSFPGAILIQDNKGYIPFEAGLVDWIATSRTKNLEKNHDHDYSHRLSSYTNAVSGAVSHAWKSTSSTFITAVSKITDSERIQGDVERGESTSNLHSLKLTSSKEFKGATDEKPQHITKSKLSPHARFCLEMLSIIVDQFDTFSSDSESPKNTRQSGFFNVNTKSHRFIQMKETYGPLGMSSRLVEHIASIPHLLETIFCMKDDNDVDFALSTSIIKKVLVNRHSVGPWITSMLQNPNKVVSRRAILYLSTVSNLFEEEENNSFGQLSSYEAFVDEVSSLRVFIPSLLSLGESSIEEVSTTGVVSKVLSKTIAKPFVATVVICDALFLGMMILGFRQSVNGIIRGDSLDSVLSWIYVVSS